MINMEAVIFVVRLVFITLVAYLLGSVNTSIIVGKVYGVDIRKEGSGNAGLTNTLRTLGKRAALVVLVGDILKGVVSILLAKVMAPVLTTGSITLGESVVPVSTVYTELSMQLAGLAVVLGHIFPVFYKFKGGKGVLTAITVIFMTEWQVGVACLCVFLVTVAALRYVSLGSILAALSCPFFLVAFEQYMPVEIMTNTLSWIIFDTILAVIIIWKHKSNIGRLFGNTERKLGEKPEAYEERMAKLQSK